MPLDENDYSKLADVPIDVVKRSFGRYALNVRRGVALISRGGAAPHFNLNP